MATMPKTQVLGAMTYEFIGCSAENQRLLLEIAQALNARHKDAERRTAYIRDTFLQMRIALAQDAATQETKSDPKWLRLLKADRSTVDTGAPLAGNAELSDFFRPRKGLWFYDHQSFTGRVLACVRDDDIVSIEGCDHIDLPHAMYDSKIFADYLDGQEEAKKYAFTLNQVKTYLTVQANGEDGPLMTNGYANIFYVLGKGGVLFAVVVDWDGDAWRVGGWPLDERGAWNAGRRIFRNKP